MNAKKISLILLVVVLSVSIIYNAVAPVSNDFDGSENFSNTCCFPTLCTEEPLENCYCDNNGCVVNNASTLQERIYVSELNAFYNIELENQLLDKGIIDRSILK